MADALLIELGGDTAGIVVRDTEGLRFFASEPVFYSLDGRTFNTVSDVHAAVRRIRVLGRALSEVAPPLEPVA